MFKEVKTKLKSKKIKYGAENLLELLSKENVDLLEEIPRDMTPEENLGQAHKGPSNRNASSSSSSSSSSSTSRRLLAPIAEHGEEEEEEGEGQRSRRKEKKGKGGGGKGSSKKPKGRGKGGVGERKGKGWTSNFSNFCFYSLHPCMCLHSNIPHCGL